MEILETSHHREASEERSELERDPAHGAMLEQQADMNDLLFSFRLRCCFHMEQRSERVSTGSQLEPKAR
jgi:hypothetical protein